MDHINELVNLKKVQVGHCASVDTEQTAQRGTVYLTNHWLIL